MVCVGAYPMVNFYFNTATRRVIRRRPARDAPTDRRAAIGIVIRYLFARRTCTCYLYLPAIPLLLYLCVGNDDSCRRRACACTVLYRERCSVPCRIRHLWVPISGPPRTLWGPIVSASSDILKITYRFRHPPIFTLTWYLLLLSTYLCYNNNNISTRYTI